MIFERMILVTFSNDFYKRNLNSNSQELKHKNVLINSFKISTSDNSTAFLQTKQGSIKIT